MKRFGLKIIIALLCLNGCVFLMSPSLWAQVEDEIILKDEADEDTLLTPIETGDIEQAVERFQERYLENYSESDDASALTDIVEWLRQNPMDINIATQQDLEQIPGLSPILAKNIVEYRRKEKYQTVRDLLKVPGMSRETFVDIKDFVTVFEKTAVKRHATAIRQRTKRNIEESKNFKRNVYEGNPYQIYNRILFSYRPFWNNDPNQLIRSGLLIEKDAGERRIDDHRVGFVEFRNFPGIRKLVLGNYQLELAQGVNLWSNNGLSKSSETIESVKKRARGLTAYQYASENSAYFGAASEWDLQVIPALKNFELTTFYSYAYYDASKNRNGTVNSILMDGFHRTPGERAKKNFLLETLGGFHANYRLGASKVGMTYYASQYNRLFIVRDTTRSLHNFSGHTNQILSAHYDLFYRNINWFGEIAKDRTHDFAGNSGLQMRWEFVEMIWFYRNYARNYNNFHSFAFGEQNGKTQNEEGIYIGLKLKPDRRTKIQSYFDIYRYPWRSYEVPRPVKGNDFLIQWEQKWWRSTRTLVRFKQENKDVAYAAQDELGREIRLVNPAQTRRLRYQVEQNVSSQIRFRTRLEHSWYRISEKRGSAESGFLIYQDVRFKPSRWLTVYGRISYFDTHSFNTAIYEYENDVEGVFSNTALYGKGVRWYTLMTYRLMKQFSVGFKYWEIYKHGVSELGSGGDAVKGQVLRKVTLTLNAQF